MGNEDESLSLLPPWKNAAAELFGKKYTYGQIVPHDEMQAAMSLQKPEGRITAQEYESWRLSLLSQVDALATFLLEEKAMCLRAVPGQGYMIVEPAKQTAFAMQDGMRRVKSELRKMGRRLHFVDRSALSHDEARENANAIARLSFLSQQARKARRLRFDVKD
jgi:hypothetical protein